MGMQLAQRVNGGGRHLRWPHEELASTPSRAAGVAEKDERVARFMACETARDLVRNLFNINTEKTHEELCNKAQVLACYYLQLFYMFQSLQQEDSRLVAIASAFLACKVVDVPRRMRGLLRALNQQRVQCGEAEFGEEEQRRTCEQILKIEFQLVRIVRFDFDLALPLEELVGLSERLLVALTQSNAFKSACDGKPPIQEAQALRPELLRVAERFTHDSFMGLAPLLAPPRFIAAGALAIATRYIRREMVMPELLKLLHAADSSLNEREMKHVIEEILNVFRTKSARDSPATAGPAAAGSRPCPSSASSTSALRQSNGRSIPAPTPAPASATASATTVPTPAANRGSSATSASVADVHGPSDRGGLRVAAVQPPLGVAAATTSSCSLALGQGAHPRSSPTACHKHEIKDISDAAASRPLPVRPLQHGSERCHPYAAGAKNNGRTDLEVG